MSGTSNLGLPGLAFTELTGAIRVEHRSTPYRDSNYLSGKASGRYTEELSFTPTVRTDFLAIPLRREVPQIVLKRRGAGFLALAGIGFSDPAQQLAGDPEFNFKAYYSNEDATAALQILSPDLVSGLVEYAADFDIEFIDRWVFFYASPTSSGRGQQRDFNPLLNSLFAKVRAQTAPLAEVSTDRLISPEEQLDRFTASQAARKRINTRPNRLRGLFLIFSWVVVLSGLGYLLLQNLAPQSP